jgi:hypothetical protein
MRSMFKNRSGLPRSVISSTGLTPTPANASAHALRASSGEPRSSHRKASPADAPAVPPTKKYQGISGRHTGDLITGWP